MLKTITGQSGSRRLAALLILCLTMLAVGQTPEAAGRGVLRLRVRLKIGDATKGLSRKRFFLIKGSTTTAKSFLDALDHQPVVSRDCYYRGSAPNQALIRSF